MSSTDRPGGRSLEASLILWFVLASSGIVLLTTGMAWFALFNGMAWRDDQVFETRADSIRDVLDHRTVDLAELDREISEDLEGPRQLFVRVVAPGSVGVRETRRFPEAVTHEVFGGRDSERVDQLLQKRVRVGDTSYLAAVEHVTLPGAGEGASATILMALDTSADLQVVDRYTLLILATVLMGVAVSIVVGRIVIQTQLRPLARLQAETDRIDGSTLDHRIATRDMPAELAAYAVRFNTMLDRLQKAYDSLRRYSDDIAHELRTPINRIQLGAEMALAGEQPVEAYRQALETTFQQCAQLSALIRNLLFIASAEHGSTEIAARPFALGPCLAKIIEFFGLDASEKRVTLSLECPPGLELCGDATLSERAVVNLVANAIAHTPAGGRVGVTAREVEGRVQIDVADTGEGIAPEDLPRIFDRFYHKADAGADGRDSQRTGLGLAITRSIMDLHGGQVLVESKRGTGTRFTLVFPPHAGAAPA